VAAEFVALADLLRAPGAVAPLPSPDATRAPEDGEQPAFAVAHDEADVRDVLREARLFRARLADAFDDAAARLLRELASDVLARELRLAPCDLAAIVRRIAARAPVLRVRVGAGDLARGVALPRGCGAVLVEDRALGDGDAVVELAGGALDARLGVRLATVLEAFA
jgi:hypothetical protein